MSLEQTLCEHAATVDYSQIGEASMAAARRATLDTVGCMIAASCAPGIELLVEMAREWGGKGEATVIGHGFKAPAPMVAWLNASMARALEIDDCTDFLPLHPSAGLVPALLAVAQTRPPLSGREFLTALAIGQDLIIRFGSATRLDGMQSGRYNLFKIFAIVAATARAIHLDALRTRHAMGIAYSLACGEGQSAVEGALTFRTHEGNAAQAAIVATMMAERGFTGPLDFLMGPMGFFTSFEPESTVGKIAEGLGDDFRGEALSFKPFASCRCTHTAIGLLLGHRHDIDVARLQSIRITVAPAVHKLVGTPLPLDREPLTQAAAQFSLAYTAAAALASGDVFLDQFTPQALARSDVIGLARRVIVHADDAMHDPGYVLGRTRIDLLFEGGTSMRLEGSEPPGNPRNQVSEEQVQRKFRKCAESAKNRLAEGAIHAWIDRVLALETVSDVGQCMKSV